MSRRSGKAASRKARQQRRARQAQAPAPRPAVESPDVPLWTDDAPADIPAPPPSTPTPEPMRAAPIVGGMSSRLGEAARLEYHYVGRDLRNTAMLVLIMAALLAGAVILVNLAGIAPS